MCIKQLHLFLLMANFIDYMINRSYISSKVQCFSLYRTVLHIIQVVICRTVLRITSVDFDTTATAQVVFPRPELYFSETATI